MNERLVELDNDDSFGWRNNEKAAKSVEERPKRTAAAGANRGQSVRKVLINSLTEVWLRDEANNHPESGLRSTE